MLNKNNPAAAIIVVDSGSGGAIFGRELSRDCNGQKVSSIKLTGLKRTDI
jgi:hypothetical protein